MFKSDGVKAYEIYATQKDELNNLFSQVRTNNNSKINERFTKSIHGLLDSLHGAGIDLEDYEASSLHKSLSELRSAYISDNIKDIGSNFSTVADSIEKYKNPSFWNSLNTKAKVLGLSAILGLGSVGTYTLLNNDSQENTPQQGLEKIVTNVANQPSSSNPNSENTMSEPSIQSGGTQTIIDAPHPLLNETQNSPQAPQLYNLDFVNDRGEIGKEKYSVNSSGVTFHIDGVEVPLTNYELFNNVLSPNEHTNPSTCALLYRLKDAQDPTITTSFNGFEDILNTYNCNKN